MDDRITLTGVQIVATVGWPDEERDTPQRLRVDVVLTPGAPFTGLNDDLSRTIDYAAVTLCLRRVALERPRKLIETLAEELALAILDGFAVRRVELNLQKFILPDVESVAVRVVRERS